jgi:hypothetical protein
VVLHIAQSLIESLRRRSGQHQLEQEQKNRRISELEQAIEGSAPRSDCPEGYLPNKKWRAPVLTIPIQDGASEPAAWVKKYPDGRVACLPEEWTLHSVPYIAEIFAAPFTDTQNDDEDTDHLPPVYPLPPWIYELLKGPAVHFDRLREEVDKIADWGLQAEIRRFRELEHFITDTHRQLDLLQAQLRGAKQAQEGCQGRLELARLERVVSSLRTLPNMGKRGFGEFRQDNAWKKKKGPNQ